jgi:hypothetical protein
VLDLTLLQKDRLPVDANWAKVEITYTGRPGDIVAIANSYDATTRYGIQSPFTDSLSFMWKGGMWHVDAQHNTLITTGNAGTKDASVAVTLFYGDKGIYELPEKTLAPGEQTWLEVGNLIRNQIPDKKGRLLPPGTMEGSYEIKDINDKQIGYLYEGKVITDKTFGHATYGCASCCNYGGVGYSGFYLLPNPLVGIVGGYGDYQGQATNQCTGQTDIVDAYSYISSNPPVATVDNAGHTSFVAPGTSNVTAYAKLQSVQNCCCRPQTYEGQAPTNVCPTSASAAWTDPLNLSLLFPTLLSGIGNVARVTVGPATSNLDGQTVTESVSQSSNTCPSVVPNACVGGSTFIVGLGYQPNVCTAWNGSTCTTRTNVGPLLVATHNQFFDQNTAVSPQSFLSSGQCTQTCSQQYYCGTQKFSDRTFTYNFQKSTMNGTTVTLVTLQ